MGRKRAFSSKSPPSLCPPSCPRGGREVAAAWGAGQSGGCVQSGRRLERPQRAADVNGPTISAALSVAYCGHQKGAHTSRCTCHLIHLVFQLRSCHPIRSVSCRIWSMECARVCVRVCVRARARVCVRARACVRACVRVCVHSSSTMALLLCVSCTTAFFTDVPILYDHPFPVYSS